MDFFPANLILAVATASATIFLGFLPTRNIRSSFFAGEILKALIAWIFIALISPPAIQHYYFFIAMVCFASWWQFRRDKALSGKMWLSIASGLGISVGVMLILAITPRAYPAGLTSLERPLLLASIYLGGTWVGLAYMVYILVQASSARSGVTNEQVRQYGRLLPLLALVRAGAIGAMAYFHLFAPMPRVLEPMTLPARDAMLHNQLGWLLLMVIVILPALAFMGQRAVRLRLSRQASTLLAILCVFGFVAEILARLLVL